GYFGQPFFGADDEGNSPWQWPGRLLVQLQTQQRPDADWERQSSGHEGILPQLISEDPAQARSVSAEGPDAWQLVPGSQQAEHQEAEAVGNVPQSCRVGAYRSEESVISSLAKGEGICRRQLLTSHPPDGEQLTVPA